MDKNQWFKTVDKEIKISVSNKTLEGKSEIHFHPVYNLTYINACNLRWLGLMKDKDKDRLIPHKFLEANKLRAL